MLAVCQNNAGFQQIVLIPGMDSSFSDDHRQHTANAEVMQVHMTLAPLEKPSVAEIASRRMKAETVIKTNKHCCHDVVLLIVSSCIHP